MKSSPRQFAAAAAVMMLAACGGSTPPPASTTPAGLPGAAAPPPDAGTNRTPEGLAAAARRDSIAAVARADSLARVAAERARADSVRAQVARGDAGTPAAPGAMTPSTTRVLSLDEQRTMTALVHFAFDSAELSAEARAVLDEKLAILRRNDLLRIEVAGHADERGSDEYNLALGLRRATAAKRYLEAYGISGDRVSVVSYGEERPLDPGANEAAWALNRRGEFIVRP